MFDEIRNKYYTPKFKAARTLQTMTRTEIEKKETKLQKTELMQ